MQELIDKLEWFPRIQEGIRLRWHTLSCKEYIDNLLADTRDGTRQGFPIEVVDILLELNKLNTDYLEDNGLYFPDFEESQFTNTGWRLPKNF